MHSIKDTLTAAIGLMVPFHHSILDECGVTKVVLGYAHYGMVSAAYWIAKCATPCILKAVGQYPAYKVKVDCFNIFSQVSNVPSLHCILC